MRTYSITVTFILLFKQSKFFLFSFFFFSSRRRHTRWNCDWSSDVCSSDLLGHDPDTVQFRRTKIPVSDLHPTHVDDIEDDEDYERTRDLIGVHDVPPVIVSEIGRASCRERVEISVVAVGVKKKR